MEGTFKKYKPYQILLLLCLGVPYMNNYELTFGVWALTIFATLTTRFSIPFLKQLFCFVAIFCIAVVVGLTYDYQKYYIIRDITYLLKPIMGLLVGYQLCKKVHPAGLHTLVKAGFIIAIAHIILLLNAFLILHKTSLNDIRLFAGYFSDYEVYVLVLLIFSKQFGLNYSRKTLILYTAIVGFSMFMYMARTNFIQFVILLIAMKGYFKINQRSVTVIVSVIVLSVVSYSAIVYTNPKRNGKGIEALLYKIKIAPEEAFKTKLKADDWRDFNDNYRSYENIMTVRQVSAKGTGVIIIGEGAGSKVDLKKEVQLGDIKQRFISILHNCFMTVFLKSGLVGVFILIVSIVLLFKNRKSTIPIVQNINLLMVGTGVFMIVSNWVFLGLYFAADTKSILIGFLICFREITVKQHRNNSTPVND